MSPANEWHPIACIFPMMDDASLQELAADIQEHGQHEPIMLYEGKILDGRNRSAACLIAGVEPKTIEVNPDDPIGFVMSENLHRRHLEPTQRAACALRARDLYDQRAKERQRSHAGTAPGKKTLVEDIPQVNARARDEVGKAFGVSGRLVDHVKRVYDNGTPELIEAMETVRVGASTASKIAVKPPEEQRQFVEDLASGKKRRSPDKTEPAAHKSPSPNANHNMTELFAVNAAGIAITQMKTIPCRSSHRAAALKKVAAWIEKEIEK